MIIENEGTYTLRYTATDDCGKTTTVDRELIVAEPWETITFADASDADIVKMVQAADDGRINLADYWHVGDERVVHLSAMEATGVGESHAEQDVTFVLMNAGGKMLADGETECSFIVGMKDSLNEFGSMNLTSICAGGWDSCARRTWCNSVFYNSIPSSIRPIFKQIKNKTANGGSDATASVESVDFFALPAEYEVGGAFNQSSSTYESGLIQFEWYQNTDNRKKKREGVNNTWFLRSPSRVLDMAFCHVSATGTFGVLDASRVSGISPFGAI